MTQLFPERRPETLVGKLWRVNWLVLIVAAAIASVGTASLYSVAGGSFEPWAERHALRFLAGLGLVLAMAVVPVWIWLRSANVFYAIALALLAAVPFFGVEALGAQRWLSLGGLTFQPSELMKVGLVLVLARYYQWLIPERVSSPLWVIPPLLLIFVPVALTLQQPDLGSAAIYAVIGLGLMFLAGVALTYFLAGTVAVAAMLPLFYASLHDYQRKRLEVFLDPEKDALGAGYHITQSKIALGSGGPVGRGFMQGTQSRLDFLPEKHTDFIFTMYAEEWGFAGAIVLLSLFAVLLALILAMALRVRTAGARLLISGAAITIFMYVVINVAMVSGLLPVVGVPLPLVSYGGTSMLTVMAALGLAMSASVHGREHPPKATFGVIF